MHNIHADNCTGQNKKNTMLSYFVWRVMQKQVIQVQNLWGCLPRTRITWASSLGLEVAEIITFGEASAHEF